MQDLNAQNTSWNTARGGYSFVVVEIESKATHEAEHYLQESYKLNLQVNFYGARGQKKKDNQSLIELFV